ncbi:MAG: arsenite methyltransferase [Planctomycetota bacterium]|nr:arsenite methyltransferase [Planctomycetota bacterium]
MNMKSSPAETTCCGPECCADEQPQRPAVEVTAVVREQYGRTAQSGLSSNDTGVRAVAEAFGYSSDELTSIPAEANMGLSCGNPTATANLRPGEVVVDLGSGGGLDVFLAAQKVGPTGKAIGIDMTPEMIELSKRNAIKGGLTNVEFHLARIDKLPLPDASVDVVISNCVINLAPDKSAVFREIARVLKPGGRLAVSDIALKQPLPEEIAKDVTAYVGCISGALLIDDYRRKLAEADFADVLVVDAGADLNAYDNVEGQSGCCTPAMAMTETPVTSPACCPSAASTVSLPVTSSACCGSTPAAEEKTIHGGLAELLHRYDVNNYAASVKVYALKPKG